ncbi:MFS transporter [Nocardia testacea]|uniref:MFS transporter n=1 Tax=Nocardia testacea TaxID=248551 RepID=UPI003C2CBFD3
MNRKWWTLVVVCAATFMLLLDVTIVVVALPDIQQSLSASFSALQWVTDAYALALAALLLTSGSLADRLGRRRVFGAGLVVFTAGSLLCGLATGPLMLIVSRALQGVGGAMLFATSLALLAATYHGRDRGTAFGAWGAITGVSTALGPILGGLIATSIGWRGIFLVNLPIGLLALLATRYRVDESRAPHARRLDRAGLVTFTCGLLALVYGVITAGERRWGDPVVLCSLGLAAVLAIVFVLIEKRTAEPMFDLSLLRTPTFLGGSIAAFTMNGSLFAMLLYLVLYLQEDQGFSALETGVRLLLVSGFTMVVATVSGRLSGRVPVRGLIGSGLLLVGVGLMAMGGLDADSAWTRLIPGLILCGIGSGLVNPPLASTAVGVVSVQHSGMASGFNNTCRQVGIAVGIAVYGSLFTARLRDGLAGHLADRPGVADRAGQLADAVHDGRAQAVLMSLPGADRAAAGRAIHAAFAEALDTLCVVSGAVAVLGAVCAVLLIRGRDFLPTHPGTTGSTPSDTVAAPVG